MEGHLRPDNPNATPPPVGSDPSTTLARPVDTPILTLTSGQINYLLKIDGTVRDRTNHLIFSLP
jgi:hypothetical protein